MKRRDFVKQTAVLVGALLAAPGLVKLQARRKGQPTVAQILKASHEAVVTHLRGPHHWVSPELRALETKGRVLVQPLGAVIEVPNWPEPHKIYAVEVVSVPMVWTQKDEETTTETGRVSLAASLLRGAIYCTDDIILERLGSGRAVASNTYRYELGEVTTLRLDSGRAFVTKLYTAIAFIN